MIPQDKIAHLIVYKHLLSTKQKLDILNALQTGNGVLIKPTNAQYGNGVWSMLASMGGKGLHVDRSRPARSMSVYVAGRSKGGAHSMYPFIVKILKTTSG